MLAKLLATACATGISAFALVYRIPALPETAPRFEVRVVTYDGQLFIAGSGDDCRAAWQGAEVPKGWQSIECVDANAPRFAFHF
ncbi:hypothetical protein [Mesorhizobium sp. M8A.F.Ca.ET.142.01.1.1]|uniref:hypothetical protein n=1 Tax=Mesorhizobium sp. M8A.F.Ca.ET.142.01.1.1 TaxID=2563958 RepID=UPI0011363F86|nr:hypothetical protein [Mesorhizobium sp. M8A.F.Ca.ET.142.01.1.1]TGV43852.1 hypothetical protein EN785_07640 [Mesorhizobium sp. M8A.F.Ca.ET.142.01.1.1]TGV96601.1 hypothetical protein EN788_56485 [Mesorhizobium sp. M2D.F.Ca.ET.145.01.1.1]